ncbi:hypothetical protein Cflav_PD6079 [Pedosphaera parvula Ellin514]|uniref:Uncharacterized protein n=1 Tax=Pedosphaera parvula (strain Ellin514) TaxID=320771 RepID=B9XAA3_PEDPL|nr:hypothetical protein Cflav_PD6079 [Pedosphaera parvula Ellin514]
MLAYAKEQWEQVNKGTNQWPSRHDLNVYLGGKKKVFEEAIQPINGEVYIINKVGARFMPIFRLLGMNSKKDNWSASRILKASQQYHSQQIRILQDKHLQDFFHRPLRTRAKAPNPRPSSA